MAKIGIKKSFPAEHWKALLLVAVLKGKDIIRKMRSGIE